MNRPAPGNLGASPQESRNRLLLRLTDCAMKDASLVPHLSVLSRLSTKALGHLVMAPGLRRSIPEMVQNEALACSAPDCRRTRIALTPYCASCGEKESRAGDPVRRTIHPSALKAYQEEIRRFLAVPANQGHPDVIRTGIALRSWILDPVPMSDDHSRTKRVYLRAREAVRRGKPQPSEIVLGVSARLLYALRREATLEPLVDPMSLKFSRYGATEAGRVLERLADLDQRDRDKGLSGPARRQLAESLPEIARLTCARLARAVEAERRQEQAAKSAPPAPFVSPATGQPLNPTDLETIAHG